MITAKQMFEAYVAGSGDTSKTWDVLGGTAVGKGMQHLADLANVWGQQASVPRVIHASFWKAYYQWAEGLEKVLRSEQVDPAGIAKRLDEEYAAACTRLADMTGNIAKYATEGRPFTTDMMERASRCEAIPLKK